MKLEPFRDFGDHLRESFEFRKWNAGFGDFIMTGCRFRCKDGLIDQYRICGVLSFIKILAELLTELRGILLVDDSLRFKSFSKEFPGAGVLVYLFVHQRLGHGWCILFVMTKLAETDNVNNHIAFERLPVIKRHLSRQYDRFRIVAIDVQNRCLNHLDHIGTIGC